MPRDLILHIGNHKTGTTTLQRTLAGSKAKLLHDHDVAYVHAPKIEHVHPYLGWEPSKGMVPHGFHLTNAKGLLEQLSASTAERTVISSENFAFFFQREKIQALYDALAGHFDRIWVVAYLRRQDSHMVSHHQEGAKPRRRAEEMLFGSEPTALPTYRPGLDLYLDYAARLEIWRRVFGADAVIPRVFEPSALRDGDTVSDFLDLLDLPAEAVTRTEDQNTSSGLIPAKVGHAINAQIENEELKAFLFKQLPSGGRFLPARAEAESFYAHYAESNRRLAKMFPFGRGEEVFELDFSRYPETRADQWDEDSAQAALASLLGSVEDLLKGIGTHELRDAAVAVEKTRPELARRLMAAAGRLRPWGQFIQNKLKTYGPSR